MPNGFQRWVHKHLSKKAAAPRGVSGNSETSDAEPPLPFLTEIPSIEALDPTWSDTPARKASQSSPFFQRLPLELRHSILTDAFGGQIVHISLDCLRPLLTPSQLPPNYCDFPSRIQHGGVLAPLREVERTMHMPVLRDSSSPRTWQWWSCVCHLSDPDGRLFVQPHQDTCLRGEAPWCEFWPGHAPAKCRIGCMGWIMSCRQS